MKHLTDIEIKEEMEKWIDENSDMIIFPSDEDLELVHKTFNRLMNESNRAGDTRGDNYTLLHDLLEMRFDKEQERPASESEMFRQYGSNKHMNYYDIFLKQGEADKIQEVLSNYGISTDVLKGISRKQDFESPTIENNGHKVKINQIIGNDGGSYYVEEFEIIIDGKTVYKWTREVNASVAKLYGESVKELELKIKYAKTSKTIATRTVNTPKRKYTSELFKTSKGNIATRRRGADGRFIKGGGLKK